MTSRTRDISPVSFRSVAGMAFVSIALGVGCGGQEEVPTTTTFDLFLNYTKPSSGVPTIEIDRQRTHEAISVPEDAEVIEINAADKRLVDITVSNVSISSRVGNFVVTDIEHSELRGDSYRGDSEFRSDFSELTRLAVVLVLDISLSLADQLPALKELAAQFVQEIKLNDPDAQIAVVAFGDDIVQLPFTTDENAVIAYIDGLGEGGFTRLRDAMSQGLDLLLDPSLQVNGRSLVTFTDGNDNASTVELQALAQRLQQARIRSYVVALEGSTEIFRDQLEPLTANGALEVTRNVSGDDGLGEIFARFSRAVSNVYRLRYQRNNTIVETPLSIRLQVAVRLKTGRFEP